MYAVDHVFVCCAAGAEEASALVGLGLTEGAPNTHPGQGTACRRFFFHNAYLELVWVADAGEAQSALARPTRLWDRWSGRAAGACPFAVILRPADGAERDPPFASWAYHPPYLPAHLAIDVAEETPLSEPAFFYIRFARPPEQLQAAPPSHRLPLERLTGVSIGLPGPGPRSAAARAVEAEGLVSFPAASEYMMTLVFDDAGAGDEADLRPELPLVLRW
jgi:hypothetical protein